jgi:hypothetical protein
MLRAFLLAGAWLACAAFACACSENPRGAGAACATRDDCRNGFDCLDPHLTYVPSDDAGCEGSALVPGVPRICSLLCADANGCTPLGAGLRCIRNGCGTTGLCLPPCDAGCGDAALP